jgi:hypothetical protein
MRQRISPRHTNRCFGYRFATRCFSKSMEKESVRSSWIFRLTDLSAVLSAIA